MSEPTATDKNAEQASYFSGLARNFGLNEGANVDKFAVILGLLPSCETHPRILECGGGAGFYTRRLLAAGYEVTCVDLSMDALSVNEREAEAIGKAASLRTVAGDFLEQAKMLNEDFDIVLFVKVLHHFPNLSAIQEALRVAQEKLRAGGQLVIFEPNGRSPLWKPMYLIQRDPVSGKSKWHYEKNLKLITQSNLLKGFDSHSDVETRFHYVIPGAVLERRLPGWRLLKRVNDALEKTHIAPFASNISFKVTKKHAGQG